MLIRYPHLFRLTLHAAIASAALMMLPCNAAFAAEPMAVYQGEVRAASGPGRKIELRLKADGTMSMISDFRNNKAPITEDGHWNAVSVEQIDLIVERRDGVATGPNTLHFVRQGDVLRTTADTTQFGSQGLQLLQTKTATLLGPPVASSANATGSWRWEGLVSAADKIDVDHPERYTLELQNGGKALVRADCNRGQAAYKLEGPAFSIKVGAMTRAACPAGSLSERFLKGLEAATAQRMRGSRLFLDLHDEDGTMIFVRAR